VHKLKHDVFSLIFKIKSSLEIISEQEKEFTQMALESTELLEKVLDRLFLFERIREGGYSLRKESFNPVLIISEVFGLEVRGETEVESDTYLFTKAIQSIKDLFAEKPDAQVKSGVLILEGEFDLSGDVKRFFFEFARYLLSLMNITLSNDSSKIELRWGRS